MDPGTRAATERWASAKIHELYPQNSKPTGPPMHYSRPPASELDPRSALIFAELFPEQIRAANATKERTGQYPWELIPEADNRNWVTGDTLTSLNQLLCRWESNGGDIGLQNLLGIFGPGQGKYDKTWSNLLLRPEILSVQDGLFPGPRLRPRGREHPPPNYARVGCASSPAEIGSASSPAEIGSAPSPPAEVGAASSPTFSVTTTIVSDKVFDEDTPTDPPSISSPDTFVETNISQVDWFRKRLGTRLKDETRHIEMLLNTLKANADMILEKLEVQRRNSAVLMALSSKIRDITTHAYESRRAAAATAKEDIPRIQKLIEASDKASDEASEQSKKFDQIFGNAHWIHRVIARQRNLLKPLLQDARDASALATEFKAAQVSADEELEKVATLLKQVERKIEYWEATRSKAQTMLNQISLVVAFAQMSVQVLKELEVKHPGLMEDVDKVIKK